MKSEAPTKIRPALVAIDGVTAAMAMFGLSLVSNDDVAKWLQLLPQPIADLGPAVLLVDHVTKAKDDRGRYAIGAQHKLAGLGGAAYTLDVLQPFGRGRTGKVKVTCTKDRLGHVRGACADGKTVGVITLDSDIDSGTVTVTCEQRQPAGQWQPTQLMAKLSTALAAGSSDLSTNELLDAVSGKKEWKREALRQLVAGGYVAVRSEGQRRLHSHVKPFPDPETTQPGPGSQPGPNRVPDPVNPVDKPGPGSPCLQGTRSRTRFSSNSPTNRVPTETAKNSGAVGAVKCTHCGTTGHGRTDVDFVCSVCAAEQAQTTPDTDSPDPVSEIREDLSGDSTPTTASIRIKHKETL